MSTRQTPFILLANERTGSTFLTYLLRSNPQVVVFNEILNRKEINWDYRLLNRRSNTQRMRSLRDANPVGFVQALFDMASEEKGIDAIGFKAIYYHFKYTIRHKMLIPYILENPAIKLIHLKRANGFKRFCSLKIAIKRKNAGATMNAYCRDDVEKDISITVDRDECLAFMREAAEEEEYFDTVFAPRNMFQVYYEELTKHTTRVMDRMQEYLDLVPRRLQSGTYKVRQQPIREVVTNYREVRAFLTDKGFGRMFKDD